MFANNEIVSDAFVSGSLGQAIFIYNRRHCILDAHDAEPRDIRPNEIYTFRQVAQELVPVHSDGALVELKQVRVTLEKEVLFFKGLDGLFVGMDPDMPHEVRTLGIERADQVLQNHDEIRKRIEERIQRPLDPKVWDLAGAIKTANKNNAIYAAILYLLIMNRRVQKSAWKKQQPLTLPWYKRDEAVVYWLTSDGQKIVDQYPMTMGYILDARVKSSMKFFDLIPILTEKSKERDFRWFESSYAPSKVGMNPRDNISTSKHVVEGVLQT